MATLETYRQRLEQVLTRLTALEFQNAVILDDVLIVLQRAEMTTRMAEEIERDCIELGSEGRLIRMQLDESSARCPRRRRAVVSDYHASDDPADARRALERPAHRCRTRTCSSWSVLAEILGYPRGVNPLDHVVHAARLPGALAHPAVAAEP